MRATFEALREALTAIGPHGIVPVKTMILLRAVGNFGGVTIRRDALNLQFFLRRALTHARIHRSEDYGDARFTHHVRLTGPDEVDASVARWLKEAYDMSTGAGKGGGR